MPRSFYGPFTSVVQKTALTAIVDQAYNSYERPLLARTYGQAAVWVALITSVGLLLDSDLHSPGSRAMRSLLGCG